MHSTSSSSSRAAQASPCWCIHRPALDSATLTHTHLLGECLRGLRSSHSLGQLSFLALHDGLRLCQLLSQRLQLLPRHLQVGML